MNELDDKYIGRTTFDEIQNTEMPDDDLASFFASMSDMFADDDEK